MLSSSSSSLSSEASISRADRFGFEEDDSDPLSDIDSSSDEDLDFDAVDFERILDNLVFGRAEFEGSSEVAVGSAEA